LKDQQIVMLGAGSAGIGVADFLRAAMREDGLSDQEARSRFWVVDKDGLLHAGRTDLTPEQRVYAQTSDRVSEWPRTLNAQIGLADVIGKIDATSLIGLSTAGHCHAVDSRVPVFCNNNDVGQLGMAHVRKWR
jgi:malate dehydrogenase (oxaloacetate-decarboxylating)